MNVKISSFIIYTFFILVNLKHSIGYESMYNELMNYTVPFQFKIQEDAFLSAPKLITKYGYPVEVHEGIITEDGYILTMHRIPFGRKSPQHGKRPVVYIQHGFISNSADAILDGPNDAIGYYMADAGFDVWLGNTRGSRYSTKHTTWRRSDRKYWDYSWSDIGYYDIPAMVDYILQTTGQHKVFYIGHSRGTTSFYVMCSQRPEYNNKIRAMASLAPVAYMQHVPSVLFQVTANHYDLLTNVTRKLNIYQYTTNNYELLRLCQSVMRIDISQMDYCTMAVHVLAGFDYENFNVSVIPIFLGHLPDSFSVKELTHFGQLVLSGTFSQYDYGKAENLRIYNSSKPPQYDLSKIVAPVILFYSANDYQSSAIDAERLYSELGNPTAKFKETYGHFTYLHGYNMTTKLYNRIIDIFSRF